MSTCVRRSAVWVFCAYLIAFCPFTSLQAKTSSDKNTQVIKVGVSPATSTAGIFIAYEKGFFKQEGLEVELQVFSSSSAPMIPLLAKGELDVGGGNITSGLFNASSSEINLKIVADKGSVRENADYLQLIVRSDLIESGKYKTLKDLKGMKIAFTSLEGTSQEAAFNRFLDKANLKTGDVTFVKLSYADTNNALRMKNVDATIQLEPYLTTILQEGVARSVAGVFSVHPYQQSAVLFYSPQFAQKRKEDAVKFMRSYIKGIREYNAAYKAGRDTAEFKSVISILKKWTQIDDDKIASNMIPAGLEQGGRINMDSLKSDAEYFRSRGYIKSLPDWDKLVDQRFIEEALKQLDEGPKPAAKNRKGR